MAIKPTKNIDPTTVGLQTIDGLSGLQFVTNKGNPASIKAKEIGKKGATATSTGFVPLDPNAQYRIINEKGKDRVLYTGTGEEGLKNVYALAQDLSATKGKKANWGVEMFNPATGEWSRVADDDPAKKWTSVVGDVVGAALPIAVQFIPGVGQLGTLAQIGLSAGAGGLGAGIAGRDPLKGALMGGLSAAGGQLLGPVVQSAGGLGNVATTLGTAVGTGIGTTAGGLATGQNLQNALMGGIASGGLSYLGGELLGPSDAALKRADFNAEFDKAFGNTVGANVGSQAAQQVGQEVGRGAAEGLGDLVVTAAGRGLAPNLGLGGASLVGGGLPPSRQQPVEENQTVVTAARQPTFDFGAAAAPALSSLFPDRLPTTYGGEAVVTAKEQPPVNLGTGASGLIPTTYGGEAVVTAKKQPPLIPVTITPAAIAADTTLAGSPAANTVPSQSPPTETPPASLLAQIAKYTTLAGLAQNLLGSLAGAGGGGGGGGGTTYTPTLGAVPTFSRGAVQPFTGDYERYGFGPEWSFFAQPAAPATTTQAAPAGILPPTNLFANTATAPYTSLI